MSKSFRDLYIWQAAVELAVDVINITNEFPRQQRWVLVEQMQRAAVSVPSNIAEGRGRNSQRELRHFLGIARGSLYELDTQLEIALRIGLLTPELRSAFGDRVATIGSGMSNLMNRL
ncbi:MAG TPA: four helix bundle protein [Thermoanaerobaculia bacterium]|jgi:four helix bundle protein|nr:four helix bundle protein [Thermoanaerobaculia bacterium]